MDLIPTVSTLEKIILELKNLKTLYNQFAVSATSDNDLLILDHCEAFLWFRFNFSIPDQNPNLNRISDFFDNIGPIINRSMGHVASSVRHSLEIVINYVISILNQWRVHKEGIQNLEPTSFFKKVKNLVTIAEIIIL